MFQAHPIEGAAKAEFYRELLLQLSSLLGEERDPIANAANTSALLFEMMPNLNWAGFYFLRDNAELVLGPFQGKPACVRIPVGRGVCGAAVERKHSILVEDVHAFPGHIACDAASRSELVAPLIHNGGVLGVLDLDSPVAGRFDIDDQEAMERAVSIYLTASALQELPSVHATST
ncbi:GAF domain-containing protein [Methylocapsa sp. S129]|uniref:GAF domain-containing protein n=1 Tax=Methylocapsa sp. S129 TaxID=1641869 RepID=UPI00131DA592|nr:GAF domain-containing protein [Methylocapsa sp. S129]